MENKETNFLRLNQEFDVDGTRMVFEILYFVKEENENTYNEVLAYAFRELYKEKTGEDISDNISLNEITKILNEKGIIQEWENDLLAIDNKVFDSLLNSIEEIINSKNIDFGELAYQRDKENQNDEELIEMVTRWYLSEVVKDILENGIKSKYLNK